MPASNSPRTLVMVMSLGLLAAGCTRKGFDVSPRPADLGDAARLDLPDLGDASLDGDVAAPDVPVAGDATRDGDLGPFVDGPTAAPVPCSPNTARTWHNTIGSFDLFVDSNGVRVVLFESTAGNPGGELVLEALPVKLLGWKRVTFAGAVAGPVAVAGTSTRDVVMANANGVLRLWSGAALGGVGGFTSTTLLAADASRVALDSNGTDIFAAAWSRAELVLVSHVGVQQTICRRAQQSAPSSLSLRVTATHFAVAQSLDTKIVIDQGAHASVCAGFNHSEIGNQRVDIAVATVAVTPSSFAVFYPESGVSSQLSATGAVAAPSPAPAIDRRALGAIDDPRGQLHVLARAAGSTSLVYYRRKAGAALWGNPAAPTLPATTMDAVSDIRMASDAHGLHLLVRRGEQIDYRCERLP